MNKPNFLFLLPDQHRGDWMPYTKEVFEQFGMEPVNIKMPNLEKMMQKGVVFTNAVTPSPLCAPARACLAAAKRYYQCGVPGNDVDYPIDQRTYYSELKEAGYSVGGVGKFDVHKNTDWWGLDGWINDLGTMGFTTAVDNAGKRDAIRSGKKEPKDPYMNYLYQQELASVHIEDFDARKGKKGHSTHATPLPEEAYCDNWLTDNGIRMLEQFPKEQPWHLVVNFTGPHEPWDVTKRMKEAWKGVFFPQPNAADYKKFSEEEILHIRQNYAAMLENIDRNIGRLLETIEKRGELENTIIIYSSDHGEMLGDFGQFGKQRPERGSVHIPMVIAGPGVQQGKYSDALVELQDVAATMVDYAGLTMEKKGDAISLRSILEGKKEAHREYQVSALGNWEMVTDGKYKLIKDSDTNIRLYDVVTDPWENHDIAQEQEEIVDCLLKQLSSM